MKKRYELIEMICLALILFALTSLALPGVSAGVGIKWDKESVLVNEGEKTCLTYQVYNP